MNINLIQSTLKWNFDDRPEFIINDVKQGKDGSTFTVKIKGSLYKLKVCDSGKVFIFGKGTDTHGDILNFKNYDQLADILLIYGN
jgi:hypothetical protein